MEISRRFRQGSILVSLIAISMLFYDFFVTRKFYIQTPFLLCMGALLMVNIMRQSVYADRKGLLFPFLVNLAIIGIACFDIWVLLIFLFGSGFSGKPIQQIWFNLTGANLLLFIMAVIEVAVLVLALTRKGKSSAGE